MYTQGDMNTRSPIAIARLITIGTCYSKLTVLLWTFIGLIAASMVPLLDVPPYKTVISSALILVQLLAILLVARMSIAFRNGILVTIVFVILMVLPPLAIVIVGLAAYKAERMLKGAGLVVRIFSGVDRSEYLKLFEGHCRGCGYDRAGIDEREACPECGQVSKVI